MFTVNGYKAMADNILARDWTLIQGDGFVSYPPPSFCVWQALRIIRNAKDTTTNPGYLTVADETGVISTQALKLLITVSATAELATATG